MEDDIVDLRFENDGTSAPFVATREKVFRVNPEHPLGPHNATRVSAKIREKIRETHIYIYII